MPSRCLLASLASVFSGYPMLEGESPYVLVPQILLLLLQRRNCVGDELIQDGFYWLDFIEITHALSSAGVDQRLYIVFFDRSQSIPNQNILKWHFQGCWCCLILPGLTPASAHLSKGFTGFRSGNDGV